MYTPTLFSKIICTGTLLAITVLYNISASAEDTANQKPAPAVKTVKQPGKASLSPEQRETFRNMMKEMQENMRGGKSFHEELQSLTEAEPYDEKKIRALIQKRHKEAEESMVKSSRALHDFYKTLSPEQKKQLDDIREEMKERRRDEMKERMKDR